MISAIILHHSWQPHACACLLSNSVTNSARIRTNVSFINRLLDENESLINVLWNDTLVHYSGYSFENLEPVVEKLCALIIKSETYKFQV